MPHPAECSSGHIIAEAKQRKTTCIKKRMNGLIFHGVTQASNMLPSVALLFTFGKSNCSIPDKVGGHKHEKM